MINFTDITTALESQINAFNTSYPGYTITRNKKQNQDDNVAVAGWVGIYRDAVNYSSHSTGATPWLAELKIRVEMQAASYDSESDCETRMENLVEFVLDAVQSNRTIGGTVQMITGYDVSYDDNYSEQMQTSYQFATLIITAEVKA